MMRASEKCSSTTFIEVDISHRMMFIANVLHRDIDLYFDGHEISGKHI